MTTIDQSAEAERIMSRTAASTPTEHLLAAIHDELRAIRDHVVPTPPETEDEPGQPLAEWERELVATSGTETERLLSAEVDRLRTARALDRNTIEWLREERDRAWTQIISLTGERDDLRAAVARVETLADEWAAAGCDGSDDTHPPTASRMCTSCASADLRAALGGERA